MNSQGNHLRAALSELRLELDTITTRARLVQNAIAGIEELLIADDLSQRLPERADEPLQELPPPISAANGGSSAVAITPSRRPLLRDSIPTILRANPSGMTLKDLARRLWAENLVGGEKDETRIEIVRQALNALKREGIAVSDIPDGEKAAIWRLRNVMLSHPPMYAVEEEQIGI